MAKSGFGKNLYKNNYKFLDSDIMNQATFDDYLYRLRKIALSIFEWNNLPSSMNERALELALFEFGMAALLRDSKYGFINTKACSSGDLNIYGLPTKINCFSFEYQSVRKTYVGDLGRTEPQKRALDNSEAILVLNNWDMLPTLTNLELYAYKLYEADMASLVNIKAQKTPVMILINQNQKLAMENLYSQYDGNQPFIFGDKDSLSPDMIKALRTDAPFVADKINDYKNSIWNEALNFLGINNIMVEKRERLISDEANSNNEVVNLNLQSFLIPRQEACKRFNEKFGFTGTEKEISVRVRSDLENIIKKEMSITKDFEPQEENVDESEVLKDE